MGDVLWIEPIVKKLASKYKKLIVYTKSPELFQNYPLENVHFKKSLSFLERVLVSIEKHLGLQLFTINLENAYENKPDIHFLHAYEKKANLPLTREYPKLYLSQSEKGRRLVKGKFVVLHIESFSDKKFRQIFGVNWEEIVSQLQSKGFKVIQIGINPQKIKRTTVLKTSLRELIALINDASYFIGIDSGPSHIAASLKIPSIIFFGAVNPLNRHFPELFEGVLLKKQCEYDLDQATVLNKKCLICKISNDSSIALCSFYSTTEVLLTISQLMGKYDSTIPI